MKIIPLALITLILTLPATNVSAAGDIRYILLAGLSVGGDDLIETEGDDLDAGGLINFSAGLSFEPEDSPLVLRSTIGIKFNHVEFTSPDGDSTLMSLPIDAVALYRTGRVMIGGGLVYDMNPEWELCMNGCGTAKFDDAAGFVLEFDYTLTETGFWGLRYTNLDYEIDDVAVDASNIRVHFGAKFN